MIRMMMTTSILMVLVLAAAECVAGQILLRPSARVAAEGPVRLADVAVLRGDDALRHSQLIVRRTMTSDVEVTLAEVRDALRAAGASMARLELSGAACRVRTSSVVAAIEGDGESESASRPEIVDPDGPPTVRRAIAEKLVDSLGVAADELRLRFESRDESFVRAAQWGRSVVVQPATSAAAARVVMEVRLYVDGMMTESRSVRVEAEVLRDAFVLKHALDRGTVLTRDMLTKDRLWVEPGGHPIVSDLEEMEGAIAKSRLQAGLVLRENMIKAPILVERNELVDVYCINGGVEIVTRGRVLADGRSGEWVQVRLDRDSRPFTARVVRWGIVVVDMNASGEGADS